MSASAPFGVEDPVTVRRALAERERARSGGCHTRSLSSGASPTWHVGDPITDCAAPVGLRFPDTSIDMGTGFDCSDPLSATTDEQIMPEQQANPRDSHEGGGLHQPPRGVVALHPQ